VTLHLPSTY